MSEYDEISYINWFMMTFGKIMRNKDNTFTISYYEDYKKYGDFIGYPKFVKEGTYKRLPQKILRRIPQRNSQNDIWQRERFSYKKDYFDELYWLNLSGGRSTEDLWNFSPDEQDTERIKVIIEERLKYGV